jgi:competence protein ComEA
MIKKLMFAVAAMIAMMGFAFAQVDVNKADAAALDSIKGIGPKTAKVIIDERTKGGDFKDWADFEKRVKGVGPKSAQKMSSAGLMVAGKSMDGAALVPVKAKATDAKPDTKAKADMKAKPAAKTGT